MNTPHPGPALRDALARDPLAQEQFLTVVSRDEAVRRFEAALRPAPLGVERVPLAGLLGRVLAEDVTAPGDVPPFDRSGVDGLAIRAADLAAAGEGAPVRLELTGEVVPCGAIPTRPIGPGDATIVATGAPLPRGADAVVMIEHAEPDGAAAVWVRRAAAPGQFVGFAGSDIARGETLLRAGTVLGSREIGMLAACGLAKAPVFRRPRVGVLSTGDELAAPGEPLRPGAIHDANGPIIAAALAENGCEPVSFGAVPDEEEALAAALVRAHRECDAVVLSGGTSKGAGDLSHRLVAQLGEPGIVVHGVALKPGKPLCLAVCDGKAVVVLPGFPTSAMFTFHDIVAPALRRLAGLPPRAESSVEAVLPVRIASELGRTEYVMVALVETEEGFAAYPTGKGSGAVTSFAQADGFVAVEALADALPAGSPVTVHLFTPNLRTPDLVVMGSHCLGLDALVSGLARDGIATRILSIGSLGGLGAVERGACDLAPIHLLHAESGAYNAPYLREGLTLVPGWRRMQGLVHRRDDSRFSGLSLKDALAAAREPGCLMVNRNAGAGTRILTDQLLAGAKHEGYWNQPRSHNAVAAAVAQGRADWGVAIAPAAEAYDLGFIPVGEEHYDFALAARRADRPAVRAFLERLRAPETRQALRGLGFRPAGEG
ncbi:MAG TPA: molybdopterin biosynthesis protein [Beijerinckiaceae bacterium]|jgi:putative molybdopterin biosynthesis protein